ncbi:MAG: hypothetical protein LBT01_09330, partial [Spirochaetaceae bacterium]|nr:hypothetical protein [Spirochaetaceae bacterium]
CTRTGEGVYAINLARRSASESRCSEGVISAPRRNAPLGGARCPPRPPVSILAITLEFTQKNKLHPLNSSFNSLLSPALTETFAFLKLHLNSRIESVIIGTEIELFFSIVTTNLFVAIKNPRSKLRGIFFGMGYFPLFTYYLLPIYHEFGRTRF